MTALAVELGSATVTFGNTKTREARLRQAMVRVGFDVVSFDSAPPA